MNPAASETPGSQVERTSLAWQRTALSVLVAALVLARLSLDDLGPAALVVLALAIPLSGWVLLRGSGSIGAAGLALTASIALLCLVELATLL